MPEIKNEWSYTPTPLYAFTERTGTLPLSEYEIGTSSWPNWHLSAILPAEQLYTVGSKTTRGGGGFTKTHVSVFTYPGDKDSSFINS